ncbi:hypothetical protein SASPL_135627 [Salvia splendens]|uniref:Uncharacterized protein n=1 Tax=Salvia splendens TaxID=180675 RepID=A0A8X8ZFN3_SALSN|nr:hypothetical protein SASPL_135627 [Salvia splendens]
MFLGYILEIKWVLHTFIVLNIALLLWHLLESDANILLLIIVSMMNLEISSRRGVGYPSDPSLKGKSTADVSNSSIDQLSRGVSDMNVNPTEDDGWQEYGKKSKNNYGRGCTKELNRNHNDYVASHPAIPPPLKNGWGWNTRAASSLPSDDGVVQKQSAQAANNLAFKSDEVDDDEEFDEIDTQMMSDDFDFDESQKRHETRKKNKWFKELFQCLDNLTVDQINEHERHWHAKMGLDIVACNL